MAYSRGSTTCNNCGSDIRIMAFKGSGYCSDDCRKVLEGETRAKSWMDPCVAEVRGRLCGQEERASIHRLPSGHDYVSELSFTWRA
jgi:hypothetical protein